MRTLIDGMIAEWPPEVKAIWSATIAHEAFAPGESVSCANYFSPRSPAAARAKSDAGGFTYTKKLGPGLGRKLELHEVLIRRHRIVV